MIWGLLPLLLISKGFSNTNVGILTGVYPAAWGISQLYTGRLSDQYSKRLLIFCGMLLQAIAIVMYAETNSFIHFIINGLLLGFGTALVYPTFLNAIADYTHPTQRAESLGVFRFWRDLGYAVGALLTGIIGDIYGLEVSIIITGMLTVASAFIALYRIEEIKK
jgi:MFS family permease